MEFKYSRNLKYIILKDVRYLRNYKSNIEITKYNFPPNIEMRAFYIFNKSISIDWYNLKKYLINEDSIKFEFEFLNDYGLNLLIYEGYWGYEILKKDVKGNMIILKSEEYIKNARNRKYRMDNIFDLIHNTKKNFIKEENINVIMEAIKICSIKRWG